MSRAQFLARLAYVEAQHRRGHQRIPDAVALMRQAGMEPDHWQASVLRSSASRQLLLACRQSGKSTTTACLALYEALYKPGSLVLLLSPSLRQSQELFRKVQYAYSMLVNPAPLQAESALRLELAHGSCIISLPGTEQTIRGYSGVDLLVIDEAARVNDELYYSVRPMLAVSAGRLVCLSTPFGKRGWFHKEWSDGEGWKRVKIVAPDCPRISESFLSEERRALPPIWYQSEYMCEFTDTTDQVFATEFVMAAVSADLKPLFT
jgi:Terminase large subunit, T4likevirus-type, N-terminal